MQAVLRPQAEAELLQAQAWYESKAPGLGLEFARAVEAAVAVAVRNPLACPAIDEQFRHVILRRFPYSLIYAIESQQLVIVSCFHHHRRPDIWRGGVQEP